VQLFFANTCISYFYAFILFTITMLLSYLLVEGRRRFDYTRVQCIKIRFYFFSSSHLLHRNILVQTRIKTSYFFRSVLFIQAIIMFIIKNITSNFYFPLNLLIYCCISIQHVNQMLWDLFNFSLRYVNYFFHKIIFLISLF